MSDLLREVDEMMKQERAEQFWKENANFIIGTILAIIIGTAAFSAYKGWNRSVEETQTAALIHAMEEEDFSETALETTQDFRPDIQALALLTAAGTNQSSAEQAIQYYDTILAGDADDNLKNFALLLKTKQSPDLGDEEKRAALQDIINSNTPWSHHARLELALLEGEAGQYKEAQETLIPVLNADIPETLKEKAEALVHIYRFQPIEPSTINQQEDGE